MTEMERLMDALRDLQEAQGEEREWDENHRANDDWGYYWERSGIPERLNKAQGAFRDALNAVIDARVASALDRRIEEAALRAHGGGNIVEGER